MPAEFNPHIENLRYAVKRMSLSEPGGAEICNAGLDWLAERLAAMEAENRRLRESMQEALDTLGRPWSNHEKDCASVLRSALAPQQQEPKPIDAKTIRNLESENQRLRDLLRDALSHIRSEYEDERETRAKIRAELNCQPPAVRQ